MIKEQNTSRNGLLPLWEQEKTLIRLGGNNELLHRIACIFLDQINDKIDSFNSALTQNNAKDIQFICHAIKGTSGDVGALALYQKASEIELLAKSNQLPQIQKEAPYLTQLASETIKAMRSTISTNSLP